MCVPLLGLGASGGAHLRFQKDLTNNRDFKSPVLPLDVVFLLNRSIPLC